jgi:hypothetical protein
MGVGLYLKGRSENADWIEQLRERMAALAHPAAEPIEVRDDGVVSARTSPVGPGYHIAVCDGRTIWFTGYRNDKPATELVESSPSEGEVFTRKDGDVLKKGCLAPGDDGFILSTRNAADGKLALVTIVFPDESDRDWAFRAWESLRV